MDAYVTVPWSRDTEPQMPFLSPLTVAVTHHPEIISVNRTYRSCLSQPLHRGDSSVGVPDLALQRSMAVVKVPK